MISLFPKERAPAPEPGHSLPPEMRQLIVDLKAEHPGFRPHELARICFLHFGRKPSDHTIKRILADGVTPTVTARRYLPTRRLPIPTSGGEPLSVFMRRAGQTRRSAPICKRLDIASTKC